MFVVSGFVVEENIVVVDPRNLNSKFAKILGAKQNSGPKNIQVKGSFVQNLCLIKILV